MTLAIRNAVATDAAECGRIIHDAFAAIAAEHNFLKDFPSVELATKVAESLIAHPGFYGVVAERDGQIIGSNFLDERSPIAGVGPITVDPARQNAGVGRQLMQAVLDRAAARNLPGVRLVQDAFHNRSMCLYTSLGFVVREPLSVPQGAPLGLSFPGYRVRAATAADAEACTVSSGGATSPTRSPATPPRSSNISDGLPATRPRSLFFAHAIGETNEDLKALIGAAPAFGGPGFLVWSSELYPRRTREEARARAASAAFRCASP